MHRRADGEQGDEKAAAEVLGQELAEQRLAGAGRADDQARPLGPVDEADQRRPGLLERLRRDVALGRRRRGERAVRQAEKASYMMLQLGEVGAKFERHNFLFLLIDRKRRAAIAKPRPVVGVKFKEIHDCPVAAGDRPGANTLTTGQGFVGATRR